MGKDEALLTVVLVACAGLVLAVMTFPTARPRIIDTEPKDEPDITITPVSPDVPSLKSLRARTLPDGGAPVVDPHMRYLASLTWGNGKNQLGRSRPRDGNPAAPMSLTTDAAGNPWVLDQVNRRIVKFDDKGRPASDVPLVLSRARDLAVAKNGRTVVLTETGVGLLEPEGKMAGEFGLDGKPNGLALDGDDIYVSYDDGRTVRVGDVSGKPDTARKVVTGRPSRDGRSFITADILDGARGKVVVGSTDRSTGERRFARELSFGMPVMTVLLAETDPTGLIYLAALGERTQPGAQEPTATVDLFCLDPADGRPLGRAELPANTSADATFREMTVPDTGGVIYLYRTEAHAELRRVDCR